MARQVDDNARRALVAHLRRGPQTQAALAAATGASAATTKRMLAELAGSVVAAGRTRKRRFALRRALRGAAARFGLYAVDPQGRALAQGELSLLEPEGSWCDLAALGWPVGPGTDTGFWAGLPYPLYDMAPQGFLGRLFAKREARELELPPDPRNWDDSAIVWALSRRGTDCSGHFIVGERALDQWQHSVLAAQRPLAPGEDMTRYPELAQAATAGGAVGSSAAGEFPKFTALRELTGGEPGHVIVKFSGDTAAGGAVQRWADLLVCEHLALEHIALLPAGQPAPGGPLLRAARARLVSAQGRRFLEVERFDRHGLFGRSPVLSLQAASDHLLALTDTDWPTHAAGLHALGLLTESDVAAVQQLWWFGRLIANTDMHLGNLSLIPLDAASADRSMTPNRRDAEPDSESADGAPRVRTRFRPRLALAPVYDMLPMAFAPLPGGEVPGTPAGGVWQPPLPRPEHRAAWLAAAPVALAFWKQAAEDRRVSAGFAQLCFAAGQALERAMQVA
ncbi:MAG TPA: HipA domain-containing protein [Burkholderiaceae bacterium]|nr:HipA domain-containing protein [Burkholderiaceae bacterium]